MHEKEDVASATFVQHIEPKVIQGIVIQVLAKTKGIALLEGNLFESLLGRDLERVKGIYVGQHEGNGSVDIRIEVNVMYGVSIPEKAMEVRERVVEEVTRWTGLEVTSVHLIFKDLVSPKEEMVQESLFEPAY